MSEMLKKLENLDVHSCVVTSDKHPFCASEIDVLSKKKVMAIVRDGIAAYEKQIQNKEKDVRMQTVEAFLEKIDFLDPELHSPDELVMIRQTYNTIAYLLRDGVNRDNWIPVSERLPEHNKIVEVTIRRNASGKQYKEAGIFAYYHCRTKKWYYYNNSLSDSFNVVEFEVLAWRNITLAREPYDPENE